MRKIDYIVIHCSATREDCDLTPGALELEHRRRGFRGIGYHYYIRRDGTTVLTRPLELVGAHVKGYNKHSIGICYEGGLDVQGRPARPNSAPSCACWWHSCCAASKATSASAGTATSVPT